MAQYEATLVNGVTYYYGNREFRQNETHLVDKSLAEQLYQIYDTKSFPGKGTLKQRKFDIKRVTNAGRAVELMQLQDKRQDTPLHEDEYADANFIDAVPNQAQEVTVVDHDFSQGENPFEGDDEETTVTEVDNEEEITTEDAFVQPGEEKENNEEVIKDDKKEEQDEVKEETPKKTSKKNKK